MRKRLALILALALTLSCTSTIFALGSSFSDVKGTVYETAVAELALKGIITGYEDGTYNPAGTLSRAEACIIVVKSMGPTSLQLTGAVNSGFSDMTGYQWAGGYVNYAVAKGIIKGYPDGSFKPADQVTYNELAAMLVLSMGYKTSDLTGTWPGNFIAKAVEVGIFKGITYVGNEAVSRGNAAVMVYNVIDRIEAANAAVITPPAPTDYKALAGRLADFSGRAYGMFLDTAKVLESDGDVVDQIEFLIGDSTVYVNTNGKFVVSGPDADKLNDGELFGLQMSGGIVKAIGDSSDSFSAIGSPLGFDNLGVTHWEQVESVNDGSVTISPSGSSVAKTILTDASFYMAVTDGSTVESYEVADLGDIEVGDWIRLYAVTGDEPGCAEVVVISKVSLGKR